MINFNNWDWEEYSNSKGKILLVHRGSNFFMVYELVKINNVYVFKVLGSVLKFKVSYIKDIIENNGSGDYLLSVVGYRKSYNLDDLYNNYEVIKVTLGVIDDIMINSENYINEKELG